MLDLKCTKLHWSPSLYHYRVWSRLYNGKLCREESYHLTISSDQHISHTLKNNVNGKSYRRSSISRNHTFKPTWVAKVITMTYLASSWEYFLLTIRIIIFPLILLFLFLVAPSKNCVLAINPTFFLGVKHPWSH